jgi:hypothetical protein
MPSARPGSSRVYVGPEPKTYTGPESVRAQSVRPSSMIQAKPKPKGRTISTQASEEDFRLMQRDWEKAEMDKKAAQRKPSSTGRPVSAKDDLVSNRGHGKKLSVSYQRPGTAITTSALRASKKKKAEVHPCLSCAPFNLGSPCLKLPQMLYLDATRVGIVCCIFSSALAVWRCIHGGCAWAGQEKDCVSHTTDIVGRRIWLPI